MIPILRHSFCSLILTLLTLVVPAQAQVDYSQAYKISTLAGIALELRGSVDGIGRAASFYHPYGVAVDSSGNVYVADNTNHKIRKITAEGVVTTLAGSGSQGSADGTGNAASFYSPEGVAVDSSGNVYVADTGNRKIRKITAIGLVTTLAGSGAIGNADGAGSSASFNYPKGVAVDGNGNVYVADTSNHKIRKISAAGIVTHLAGSGSSGSADGTGTGASFYNPRGVAVDSGGNVFVADTSNHKIRKITVSGVVTTVAGSGTNGSVDGMGSTASFYAPCGVAVDSSGNVYVADTFNLKIRKISSAGMVVTLAGTGVYGSVDGMREFARFNNPFGVAVDSSGTVYVADTNNHKIRKISVAGAVTSLAGRNLSEDGTGSGASFFSPSGVALDGGGNVYVADKENHQIRKITAMGVVTTIAGSEIFGSTDGSGNAASFKYPNGVAVDSSGTVYVADTSNRKIRKITAAGLVTTLAGSGSSGSADGEASTASFNDPSGVAVDSTGNVYVAESTRIRKISNLGIVTTLAGAGGFSNPQGVAVDANGNVYVADTFSNRIRKISVAGAVTTLAGSDSGGAGTADGAGSAARFSYPRAVAVNSIGEVYVVASNQIRKISAAGVVTTLAGTSISGSADGTGNVASLYEPSGIALDSSGRIYVADRRNHIIRKGVSSLLLSQTISFAELPSRTFGQSPVVLSATASSGLPITFQVISGPADLSGNTLTITGVGTVVVRAIQSGNTNYQDATTVDQSFVVSKTSQAITFGILANRVFSQNSFGLPATASSGLQVTFQVVSGPATLAGSNLTMTGLGTVVVRANQEGNANYLAAASVQQSFVVTQATHTITFSSLANRAYSQSPFVLSASASSGLAVTFQIVSGPATISGNNLTMTGLGTVVVRASHAGNANFLAAASVEQSFEVTQASQTITFGTLTNRTFGQVPFSLSATSTSSLPVSLEIVSGPATISGTICTVTGVGTVVVRAIQAGNTNYSSATPVERSFTVAKASQSITFGSLPTKNPTDPAFVLAATSNSGLAPVYSLVSGPATLSGNVLTLTGSGTVTIRASQPGNENYLAAANVDQSFLVRNSQTISFPSPSARPLANVSIPLSATSTSGLAVSFTLISGPATLSGNSLTLTGTGMVVIKATQAGNATIAPAPEVTVSFEVTPNTGPPTAITLTKTYFFDNVPNPSELSVLSALDPDTGDSITYTLISGTGSTDNAKFTIVGDRLRSATHFNYNTQRYLSIRVAATDSAGQSYEQILQLQVIPSAPNARFIAGSTFTESPNYVNSIFQLVGKNSGRGINYPKAFFDTASPDFQANLFQAFEAASVSTATTPVPQSESYFQVAKMDEVPTKVRTVLLIDNSSSISLTDLEVIKSAAKIVIDKMFDQQEIAIYSFSGSYNLIANFTAKSAANQVSLKAAIDTIGRGSPTTNLYGSMLAMLSLPEWKESFKQEGIDTGFLVVLTDGQDTSGSATLAEVKAKRDLDRKRIYTIGLGASIDPAVLQDLQNTNLYIGAANSGGLAAAFEQIQNDIIDLANSFYWVNYSSPKRQSNPAGQLRKLEVKVSNNSNFAADGILSSTFNSDGFSDLDSAVFINRKANLTRGVSSLSIAKASPYFASAITIYPPLDFSSFTWSIGDPTLATLTPQGTIGERLVITPNNLNGTTTLTLTDTISNSVSPYTRTIPLIIGTGVGLPAQQITFATLADRLMSDAPLVLSATSNSGLPVTFSVVSGSASLAGDGKTLTPNGEGIITVRASQAGNASFAPAVPVDRSFTVSNNPGLANVTAAISAAGVTGPQATPNGIPFNDGVQNLLKYAFNMNLAGADTRVLAGGGTAGLPKVTATTSGPTPVLSVEFIRRKNSGLIYTPLRSGDLAIFTPMTGTQTVTSIDSQWERVVVQDMSPPQKGSNFARVEVKIP